MDPDILWQELDALTVTNSFFDNKVEAEKYRVEQAWSRLEKPSPPHIDVMPAWTPEKHFLHPAECLRPLSYGAFGQMSGRILASNVLVECPSRHGLWDNTTRANFQRRADCFVDQYSKFSTAGPDGSLNVNGKLTLRQNIADAAGLRAAFRAWKKQEKETPGYLLPGMERFTPDQLLFIRYAQQWCEKNNKENARYQHYTDPYHAPGHARILGTVANSEEFKEAFGCEKKETECKMW
jgi:endothelin-converting enzyme